MTETLQIQNNANQTARTSNRILWVDYSKVLVIWLMILGHVIDHSGVDGYVRVFIYSFHMPFFFFISGYLHKDRFDDFLSYTNYNIKSLIIPYCFLRLLTFFLLIPFIWFKHSDISHFPVDFITGSADFPGGPCWFLLSMFCLKEIYYFYKKVPQIIKIIVLILLPVAAYYFDKRLFWNLDAAFMAFPFYAIGYFFKTKGLFKNISSLKIFIAVLLLISTIIISQIEGFVTLYNADFGKMPILFYPGAFFGSISIILLCKLFKNSNDVILTLSKGTIVIMGLHCAIFPYLILFYHVKFKILYESSYNFLFETIIAFLTMFLLYKPIMWLQKYVPFLIGNRR